MDRIDVRDPRFRALDAQVGTVQYQEVHSRFQCRGPQEWSRSPRPSKMSVDAGGRQRFRRATIGCSMDLAGKSCDACPGAFARPGECAAPSTSTRRSEETGWIMPGAWPRQDATETGEAEATGTQWWRRAPTRTRDRNVHREKHATPGFAGPPVEREAEVETIGSRASSTADPLAVAEVVVPDPGALLVARGMQAEAGNAPRRVLRGRTNRRTTTRSTIRRRDRNGAATRLRSPRRTS